MRHGLPWLRQGVEQGFTLIELLLAMTLGAIVLTAARLAFSTAIDSQRRGARVLASTQAWRYFSNRLQHDLRTLSVSKPRSLNGTESSLRFRAEVPDSGPGWVQYRYVKTPTGGQIRRSLESKNPTDTVVYEGVDSFHLRYLQKAQWRDSSSDALPAALFCTVKAADRERELLIALDVDDRNDKR